MAETTEIILRRILCRYISLKIPAEQITLEDKLEDIGVDSISFMKVVVAIEQSFGFEFKDEDLIIDNFERIKNVIRYIDERKMVNA